VKKNLLEMTIPKLFRECKKTFGMLKKDYNDPKSITINQILNFILNSYNMPVQYGIIFSVTINDITTMLRYVQYIFMKYTQLNYDIKRMIVSFF